MLRRYSPNQKRLPHHHRRFALAGSLSRRRPVAHEQREWRRCRHEPAERGNVTVLEWLHQKRAFTNRVVAFANWDVFPYILNTQRSGIPMWTGFETNSSAARGSRLELLEQLFRDTTPLWPDMNFDAFFFHAALENLKTKKPRVIWIAFSEPDEWAHEGRYDYYLSTTHKIDSHVSALWEAIQ